MSAGEKILLKWKFLKNCTNEEEYFLKQLEGWLDVHNEKAEDNKKKYRSLNEKVIAFIAKKSGIDKIIVIILKVASFLAPFAGTIVVSDILNILNLEVGMWYFIIMVTMVLLVASIVLIVREWYRQVSLKKILKLGRYGETWVRHTVAAANYEKEILSYICTLGAYEGKTEKEQRKLFMQNILTIFQKNIDKFEENMKSIEEVVE